MAAGQGNLHIWHEGNPDTWRDYSLQCGDGIGVCPFTAGRDAVHQIAVLELHGFLKTVTDAVPWLDAHEGAVAVARCPHGNDRCIEAHAQHRVAMFVDERNLAELSCLVENGVAGKGVIGDGQKTVVEHHRIGFGMAISVGQHHIAGEAECIGCV